MPDDKKPGNPEKESGKEEEFDFESLEKFFDEGDKHWMDPESEEPSEEEKGESEVPGDESEEEKESEEEQPKKTPLSKEDQSFKDKYYALDKEVAVLKDRLQTLMDQKSGDEPEQKGDSLEDLANKQWGDDPVIQALVKKIETLEANQAQRNAKENSVVVESVKTTMQDFMHERKDQLDNKEIGMRFIDELDDRLPDGGFEKLYEDVAAGKSFAPGFAEKLKGKMERAYKSAIAKNNSTVDQKKKESEKRKDKRSSVPKGVTPQEQKNAPDKTPNQKISYKEARRLARTSRPNG